MEIKFDVRIDANQLKDVEAPALKEMLLGAAETAYRQREAQFPVMAAFTRYRQAVGPNQYHVDGNAIIQHAAQRFEDPSALAIAELDGSQVYDHLVKISAEALKRSDLIERTALE
ncbi:MAG: hypothetical protein ACK53L_11900, partial [Pirellulaceae bacterium]